MHLQPNKKPEVDLSVLILFSILLITAGKIMTNVVCIRMICLKH